MQRFKKINKFDAVLKTSRKRKFVTNISPTRRASYILYEMRFISYETHLFREMSTDLPIETTHKVRGLV